MLKTVPCVVLTSLKASTYSEYASAFRSLRPSNELVLSILPVSLSETVKRKTRVNHEAAALLDSDFEHPGKQKAVSKGVEEYLA
jgi:hypothetical protein